MGSFCDFIFSATLNKEQGAYLVIKAPCNAQPLISDDNKHQFSEEIASNYAGTISGTIVDHYNPYTANNINENRFNQIYNNNNYNNNNTIPNCNNNNYNMYATAGTQMAAGAASVAASYAVEYVIEQARKTHPQTDGYQQIFESEKVSHSNPVWNAIRISLFSLCQGNLNTEVLIECYEKHRFGSSGFIGSFKVKAGELICNGNEAKRFEFKDERGYNSGQTLHVRSKASVQKIVSCELKINGTDLVEKGLFGGSDPYFVIKTPINITEDANLVDSNNPINSVPINPKYGEKVHSETRGYREVYESEMIRKNLNPDWMPIRIGFYEMCKAKQYEELLIECWDYNSTMSNRLIGSVTIQVKKLLDNNSLSLPLLSKKNTHAGALSIQTHVNRIDSSAQNALM